MTQTVELLLDDRTEDVVRAEWDALAAAGLPSQAHHTAASNRPHVTLVAQNEIAEAAEPDLVAQLSDLPLPVLLSGLLCFGAGPFILVRPLVVDVALLDLQHRIQQAAGRPSPLMAPGRWVPHVTLARRLSAEQVASALTVLGGIPAGAGHGEHGPAPQSYAVSARRWDGTAKREWPLR